jgi:hypothetical protein
MLRWISEEVALEVPPLSLEMVSILLCSLALAALLVVPAVRQRQAVSNF